VSAAPPPERVLLISPVRNEEEHVARTARALAAQTRPPDLWLVVDDGSDDATPELLHRLAVEIPFMRVLSTPDDHTARGPDRLALAAEARAFNWALAQVDGLTPGEGQTLPPGGGSDPFTHIGKLDGDIELQPDYLERLLGRFARDPDLGIAGGVLVERRRGGWREDPVPDYHVRGALKLYSSACFERIGGIEERLGWDTIDETYARMHGFGTRSFGDLVARHHRPVATADGALRGRARHGQCAYILGYGLPWVALRSLKVAASWPQGLSGAAFLYGYLRSAVRRDSKVEDPEFRRFTRRELRARLGGSSSVFRPFVRRTS
jgi:poly-beta-1,6-N-acetyl-D-glucosamine synthase